MTLPPPTQFGGSPVPRTGPKASELLKGRGAFGERACCLFGLAAQVLGWRPDEFWAATPAELAWAMRDGDERVEPVSADEICELMVRFPDGVR